MTARDGGRIADMGEAGALFDALFLRHPSPMWIYDPETLRFLVVNDAAVALYGFTRPEFAGLTVLDIRPEPEREPFRRTVASRENVGRTARWRHMKKSGEVIDVMTVGFAVRFGGVDAILAVVSDRSEISQAHREASESRSMLDSIVANLPIGVFVKDMNDDIRYILYNEACAQIVGVDASDIVGRTDLAVFSSNQGVEFRRQDAAVFAGGTSFTAEEVIPRPSGEERIVRTIKRVLPAPPGLSPRYLLGVAEDVTERRSYQQRIAHIALHDALTDLPNRAFFTEHLEALLSAGAGAFALFLIDVDHFKVINDSLGHPAGDALLREIGGRLTALKGDGIVARLGGDEFALVAPIPHENAAKEAAERAGRLMAAFEAPFHFDGACEHIAASVGVALAPEHGGDVNTLFRNADLALYAAKADGRSTFRFYESEMRLHAEQRHALTVELRRGLAENEFELFFQPLLSLCENRITGFEALIRWRHPERGLLAPGAFIAVAEEAGLIVPIGEWVIRTACRAAASWPDGLSVAVNLSSLQFRQIGLLASVVSALSASGLRPDRLELEITESVLLSDSRQNLQILHALRALGIRIAMDDFGTGYSSLSNLRSFPFSKIKMDRSFTAGIGSDPGSLAIARAVMGLATGFNLVTTAEGVETAEQLERLRGENFGEAQGYYIAKPMPEGEVEAFLAGYGQALPVKLSA
jgi:diguanylate cyclase (GGDEF)-like protein/PAS domain S-box-containing protein